MILVYEKVVQRIEHREQLPIVPRPLLPWHSSRSFSILLPYTFLHNWDHFDIQLEWRFLYSTLCHSKCFQGCVTSWLFYYVYINYPLLLVIYIASILSFAIVIKVKMSTTENNSVHILMRTLSTLIQLICTIKFLSREKEVMIIYNSTKKDTSE